MTLEQVSHGFCAIIFELAVSESESLEGLVATFQDGAHFLGTLSVDLRVSYIEILYEDVGIEDRQEDLEIFAPKVVFADVERLDSVCVFQRKREVLESKAVKKHVLGELVGLGLHDFLEFV